MKEAEIKNSTPLFSVLIANYNNGQYLEECLQSVFDQTYTNWEIILVDDGSTDEISHAIYQKYNNDSKIKVFKNEENRGCGYTKRRCAEEANGEICAFLDPDDTISSTAIEIMVKKHVEYPKYSLVYSTHYLCDENLQPYGINKGVKQVGEEGYFCSNGAQVSASSSYKNEAYKKTSGIDSSLKRAVDQDLYYKLDETGKFLFVNEPLYYYRRHKNGISTAANEIKARYWHLQVKKDTFKRRKSTNKPNLKRKDLDQLEFSFFIGRAIEKSRTREYKKMFYCLRMASKHLFLDKNFSIIRIAISPLKNVINRWPYQR